MKRLLFICGLVFLASAAQAQTPVGQAPIAKRQFFTAAGIPLAGGKIYTCVAGAACPGNPLATYTDSTGTTQNSNPIILDSGGFVPGSTDIYLTSASYKFVAQTSLGATVWTADNVTAISFLTLPNTWTALQTFNAGITSAGPNTLNGGGTLAGTYASTGLFQCKNFESVLCVDSANSGSWAGTDAGGWSNSAYAALASIGGGSMLAPGVYNYSTPINFGTNGKTNYYKCLAPSSLFGGTTGATVLNFTPTSGNAFTVATGSGGGIEGCQLKGPGSGTGIGLNLSFAVKQVYKDLDLSGFGVNLQLNTNANQAYLNNFFNIQIHDAVTNNILLPTGASGTESIGFFGGIVHQTSGSYSATCADFGTGTDVNVFNLSFDHCGITVRGTNPKLYFAGSHFEDPVSSVATPFVTVDTTSAAANLTFMGTKWTEDFASGRTAMIQANGAAGGNILSAGDLIHSVVNPLPAFIALGASSMTATVIGAQSDGATITSWCSGGTACLVLNPTFVSHTITGTNTFNCQLSGGVGCVVAYRGSASGNTTLQASAAASGTLTLPAATDTLVGKATTDILTNKTLTSPTISNPTITSGVAANGSGFKHSRSTAGCTTAAAAGATCTTVVTWGTAFADGNYTPVCNGFGITSGIPLNGGTSAALGASITFTTVAATAVAAQYTSIACMAGHD